MSNGNTSPMQGSVGATGMLQGTVTIVCPICSFVPAAGGGGLRFGMVQGGDVGAY